MRVLELQRGIVASELDQKRRARWAALAGGGLQPAQGGIENLEACSNMLAMLAAQQCSQVSG